MSLTRVGRRVTRIFDQYSVICVFGSVFGCVVVPLLTQSVETLIFSAIVISLTAKRMLTLTAREPAVQDERRRAKDKDERKAKRNRKTPPAGQPPPAVDVEQLRRQRESELKKLEETRRLDREKKLEERRDKKARRREERNRLKQEESKEKEREEKLVKQIREDRAMQKQQEKEIKAYLTIPLETIKAAIVGEKPLRRERKNSTSSSASSGSANSSNVASHPQRSQHHRSSATAAGKQKHNHPTRRPTRASSDPQLAGSSPSPPPLPFLNNHAHTLPAQSKGWQPLPDPQGSPPWCPDLPDQQTPPKTVASPSRQRKQNRNHSSSRPRQPLLVAPPPPPPSLVRQHVSAQIYPTPISPPPHYHGNQQHAPPPNWGSIGAENVTRVVYSKCPETSSPSSSSSSCMPSQSVVSPFPQRGWVPGPHSAPANLTSQTIPIGTHPSSHHHHSTTLPLFEMPSLPACYTTATTTTAAAAEAFAGGDLSPVLSCDGREGSYSLFSNEQSPFSAVFLSGFEGAAGMSVEPGKEGVDEWPAF